MLYGNLTMVTPNTVSQVLFMVWVFFFGYCCFCSEILSTFKISLLRSSVYLAERWHSSGCGFLTLVPLGEVGCSPTALWFPVFR